MKRRLVFLLTCFIFITSFAETKKNENEIASILKGVPSLDFEKSKDYQKLNQKITLKLKVLSKELKLRLEKNKAKLFSAPNVLKSSKHIIVIQRPDLYGATDHVILGFDDNGKLISGDNLFEKWSECQWDVQDWNAKVECSGSEGGASWEFKNEYDFKKKTAMSVTLKSSEGE